MIFIDEGQDAVRRRVQAVKAIAQSEVSAIGVVKPKYLAAKIYEIAFCARKMTIVT